MRVWCTISFMGKSAPLLAALRGYKSSHKIQMRPVKLSLLGTQRVCGADPTTEGPWSSCFYSCCCRDICSQLTSSFICPHLLRGTPGCFNDSCCPVELARLTRCVLNQRVTPDIIWCLAWEKGSRSWKEIQKNRRAFLLPHPPPPWHFFLLLTLTSKYSLGVIKWITSDSASGVGFNIHTS